MSRVIDAHQHCWERGRFRDAWLDLPAHRVTEPDPVGHGLRDHVVCVALHHGAEAVVEVQVLVPVDVPHLRTLTVGEVDRPGVA